MPIPRSDRNRVDLVGEVTGPVRFRSFDSGSRLLSFAVRTRTGPVEAVATDSLPVAWWEPALGEDDLAAGTRVRVQGRLRRRFFTGAAGLRSVVEVGAESVQT